MDQVKISTVVDARLHVLYCGTTMSGKTTLARHHARILAKAGYEIVVYDPVGTATAGGDWPKDTKIYSDPTKFLEYLIDAKSNHEHPIFVFIDEAADIFGHESPYKDTHWIPRKVRHQNVYLRLVSQRPKMLPPNTRTQCGHVYMFRLSPDDAQMVAADCGHSWRDMQITLDNGDFVMLVSGTAAIETGNVFEMVD